MDDDTWREAQILMAPGETADRLVAEECEEHFRELEKNFGETLAIESGELVEVQYVTPTDPPHPHER